MRRFPFYAYPNLPQSFYTSPAQAPYHGPRHPFPPSSPPRSVISVPVSDTAPSPLPPQPNPAVPPIDRSSAATTIQSHFRGFCVRRHRPLLHLRSIASARGQLEELRLELASPGSPLKVRASEKERLRFSERVMAIILRLDAIEGSVAEVRSQRKEATKMAVKLQDAIDGIVAQKDGAAALNPTTGPFSGSGMALDDDSVLLRHCEEPLCPDVNMVQEEADAISEKGTMDVSTVQEKYISPEDGAAYECTPSLDKEDGMDMVAENFSPLHFLKEREAGEPVNCESGRIESAPQVMDAEAMYEGEQDQSQLTGENAGSDAEEDGIDAIHVEAHKNGMQNHALDVMEDQDTFVHDMIVASHGPAGRESFDGSYTGMDAVQEAKELCPGIPTSEAKCDSPYCISGSHHNQLQLQDLPIALDGMRESNRSSDTNESPTSLRHGYEEHSKEPHENCSDEGNSCEEAKADESARLSMAGTLSSLHDSSALQQLSEECRQLKSLVGKLLAQNRAQSNILCALGERLQMLELQQRRSRQQKMQEKRKARKGSKRTGKWHDCQ